MGARGPKKGTGGRPRKEKPTPMLDGYIRITVGPPGKGKRVLEHRWVAEQSWGSDPRPCEYCGRIVRWDRKWPHPDAIVVDHIDQNHSNNDVNNLRPSCGECNARRTANSKPIG